MKQRLMVTAIVLYFSVFGLSLASAGEIDAQLVRMTDIAQGDFGTGTYPASIVVYAGDVIYEGTKIGTFTATSTGTKYTGIDGVMMQYDVIIPPVPNFGDSPSDFFSMKTNHVITGILNPPTVERGVIYTATGALNFLMGLEVVISGDALKIMY